MEPMIISNLNVCSDMKTIHLFKDITTDLKKTFQNLSCSLKPIKIYYGTKYTIVQNVVYSEETILNTVNIILVLDPVSIQYDITTITNKIANTKYTIEQVFTKIPKLLYRPNIQYRFLNCTFQNNKLIFLIIGNKSEILNTIQRTANSMVFGAYMPCRAIQLQTPETNERNIFNCPQVVKEEDDAKKKTEEQDEISYIRQSKSPSPLKLSPLEFSDSTAHENESGKTYQSKVSVADALSLIKQKVTEDHIILIESEFVNIKNAFGRISAQAVTSCNDLPRFQVATKIEYAVEVEKEIEMKTHESSESSPIIFDPNTSVLVKKGERISLDAATAVILKKNDTLTETEMSNNLTSCTIKNQQNVTLPGSNIKKDKLIIDKCTHILSREVMLLKMSNRKKIKVYEKLSIGVMAIGNESKLELNCNKLTLDLLLKENKFDFNSVDLENTNNPEDIIQNITAALEHVDLLVTTGYFSDKNCVKNILTNHFKAVFLFENVNMKPGKSTAFASCYFKNKPKVILCLPEKPASVLITAYVFLLPLVKWIHFNSKEDWSTINVAVDQTLLLHSRPRYVWTNLSWDKGKCFPKVRCKKERSINYFLSNSDGNALLILPPKTLERSTLEISSRVSALPVKFPFFSKKD